MKRIIKCCLKTRTGVYARKWIKRSTPWPWHKWLEYSQRHTYCWPGWLVYCDSSANCRKLPMLNETQSRKTFWMPLTTLPTFVENYWCLEIHKVYCMIHRAWCVRNCDSRPRHSLLEWWTCRKIRFWNAIIENFDYV